jgi:hypothetical protein
MDLNRLTRDADELIRKVVTRYNQLYAPAGSVSQVELDLMLDDLRKLYDTFKTIGQINLTLQQNAQKPAVSVNAPIQNKQQHNTTSSENTTPAQTTDNYKTEADFQPAPAAKTEPTPSSYSPADPETEIVQENVVTASSDSLNDPEPAWKTEPETEPVVENIIQEESPKITETEKPAPKPAESPVQTSGPDSSPSLLADKFNTGSKSLSETIASSPAEGVVGSRLLFHPIADLTTGIALNDKFSFISELFANNAVTYEEAVTRVNKAVNLDEANWILQKYHTADWEQKHESLTRLKDFIKRRFI